MSHLILATSNLAADNLRRAGIADAAVGFSHRFVRGLLPEEAELATLLEPRSAKHHLEGQHWLDHHRRNWLSQSYKKDFGVLQFCDPFDSIELWVDPQPNDQLVLIWLLHVLRPHREIISKLSLVQTDDNVARYHPDWVAKWRLPAFKISDRHLTIASRAWHAYRAPTPQDCFDLLSQDLMILPRLRSAIIALLEELPDQLNGLGASEMGMLEYVADGCTEPRVVLGAAKVREVFDEREAGILFDELAQCPEPLIFGLGEAPFEMSDEARHHRYSKGRVALTELGRAVVEGEDDLWRHNPIRRWWGGTELINERLWRWDPQTRSLVAPE